MEAHHCQLSPMCTCFVQLQMKIMISGQQECFIGSLSMGSQLSDSTIIFLIFLFTHLGATWKLYQQLYELWDCSMTKDERRWNAQVKR